MNAEVEVTVTLTLSLPVSWSKRRTRDVIRNAIDVSEIASHVAPGTAPAISIREEAEIYHNN